MGQCAQHLRAAVHFQDFVTDIPNDTGTRLDFKQIRAENATLDLAIDHQVVAAYLAFHTGMFWVILLSTTLTAGALLALCRWWFNREQVLFRN